MRGEKVAIIMGAGASLADGLKKPQSKWPPLDRGFFAGGALKAYGTDLRPIVTYMEEHYGADLRKAENDSLERVMAVLYTDVYGGDLQTRAFEALRSLIRVFLKRLASTTNDIDMTSKSLLYRIVSSFLNAGVVPADVAIITFNQDIQAEKALAVLQKTKKWASKAVFSFPQCYHLPRGLRVTSPTNAASPRFTISSASSNDGIALLKLHGSLNWYSRHNSPNPTKKKLFDPKRVIGITSRKRIDTSMNLEKGGRTRFTFPIIIPPVVHKSGILHENLVPVWSLAEKRLRTANRVVIFGYSCPGNDWESANLIGRCLTANKNLREISVIDPDPGVVLRYVGLGHLKSVAYFASASAYLKSE